MPGTMVNDTWPLPSRSSRPRGPLCAPCTRPCFIKGSRGDPPCRLICGPQGELPVWQSNRYWAAELRWEKREQEHHTVRVKGKKEPAYSDKAFSKGGQMACKNQKCPLNQQLQSYRESRKRNYNIRCYTSVDLIIINGKLAKNLKMHFKY